jgi:cell division protein FtsB
MGYFGVSLIQTVADSHNHQDQLSIMEDQITSLKERRKGLEQQLKIVKSPQFIEAEARNKLNLAKSNETVVIFPQESAVLAETSSSTAGKVAPTVSTFGYLGEWLEFIFG